MGEKEWPHEPTAIGVPSGWFVGVGWALPLSAVIRPDPGQTTGMLQLWMAAGGNGMRLKPVERAMDENGRLAGAPCSHGLRALARDGGMRQDRGHPEQSLNRPQVRRRQSERMPGAGRLGVVGMRRGLRRLADASAETMQADGDPCRGLAPDHRLSEVRPQREP